MHLEQFLKDAAECVVTDPASVDAAFRAYAQLRADELYHDTYVKRWIQNNKEDFPLVREILGEVRRDPDHPEAVSYLEIACGAVRLLPDVRRIGEATEQQYNDAELLLMNMSTLAQDFAVRRRRKG